jgi:hypothetical protein
LPEARFSGYNNAYFFWPMSYLARHHFMAKILRERSSLQEQQDAASSRRNLVVRAASRTVDSIALGGPDCTGKVTGWKQLLNAII